VGSTKERARSVVGLLTSLGLVAPGAAVAGCIGTTNPLPQDAGMDALDTGVRFDAPLIENAPPPDFGFPDAGILDVSVGTENPAPPVDDAPADDDAGADDAPADDDAGTAG
jgi:hypothetical protein